MVYFTSDLHLGHPAIIRMKNRPFADIEEMNQVLIHNYNSLVHKHDTVYILGDICYHLSVEQANDLIAKLHGKKILITGNHDKQYDRSLFEEVCDFKVISVYGVSFALMHYPMISWPHLFRGGIHVHGHLHSYEEYNLDNFVRGIRRYDVGVDANNFYPVSAQNVIDFFQDCQFCGKEC